MGLRPVEKCDRSLQQRGTCVRARDCLLAPQDTRLFVPIVATRAATLTSPRPSSHYRNVVGRATSRGSSGCFSGRRGPVTKPHAFPHIVTSGLAATPPETMTDPHEAPRSVTPLPPLRDVTPPLTTSAPPMPSPTISRGHTTEPNAPPAAIFPDATETMPGSMTKRRGFPSYASVLPIRGIDAPPRRPRPVTRPPGPASLVRPAAREISREAMSVTEPYETARSMSFRRPVSSGPMGNPNAFPRIVAAGATATCPAPCTDPHEPPRSMTPARLFAGAARGARRGPARPHGAPGAVTPGTPAALPAALPITMTGPHEAPPSMTSAPPPSGGTPLCLVLPVTTPHASPARVTPETPAALPVAMTDPYEAPRSMTSLPSSRHAPGIGTGTATPRAPRAAVTPEARRRRPGTTAAPTKPHDP
jgi:hypothetical protein